MRHISRFGAILLVVAACGGTPSNETSRGTTSPIADFLHQPDFFGDERGAQELAITQERASEAKVAECMAELGFEYLPRNVSDTILLDGDSEEFGSDEWTEKYGFGITTLYFSQGQVGPDLIGYDDSEFQAQIEDDPNQAIVDAMSESEQAAYHEALWGDQDSFVFDETLSDEEIEAQLEDQQVEGSGGCQGEAWNDDPATRFYQEFGQELVALEAKIAADPRVVEVEREIADCVAERGLEYTPGVELWANFQPELKEIESSIDYSVFAEVEEGDEPALNSFEQPELSDEAKAQLGELQAKEIDLAVAVNDCGGGFNEQQAGHASVRAEYEQQWLDDNADRVADFGAE